MATAKYGKDGVAVGDPWIYNEEVCSMKILRQMN
jgi:hypothetical protein